MTDGLSSRQAESSAGPPLMTQVRKFNHMVRRLCGSRAAELYRAGYLNEEMPVIIEHNGSGVDRMPAPALSELMRRVRDRFSHDQDFLALFDAPDALPEVSTADPVVVTAEKLARYRDRMGLMIFDLIVQVWPLMNPHQQSALFQKELDMAMVDDAYPSAMQHIELFDRIKAAVRLSSMTDPKNPGRVLFYLTGDRNKTVVCTARNRRRATSRLVDEQVSGREIEAAVRQMTQNDSEDFDLLEGGEMSADDSSSVVPLVDSATQAYARPKDRPAPDAVGLPANPGESSRAINTELPALPGLVGPPVLVMPPHKEARPAREPRRASVTVPSDASASSGPVAMARPRPPAARVEPAPSLTAPTPSVRPAPVASPPVPTLRPVIPPSPPRAAEPVTAPAPTPTPAATSVTPQPASPATPPARDQPESGRSLPPGNISGYDLPALGSRAPKREQPRTWRRITLWVVVALALFCLASYVAVDVFVGPAKPRFAGLADDPSLASVTSLVAPDPQVEDNSVERAQLRDGPLTLRGNLLLRQVGRHWEGQVRLRNNTGRRVRIPRDLGEYHTRVTHRPGAGDLELVAVESWNMTNGKIGLRLIFASGRAMIAERPIDPAKVQWTLLVD